MATTRRGQPRLQGRKCIQPQLPRRRALLRLHHHNNSQRALTLTTTMMKQARRCLVQAARWRLKVPGCVVRSSLQPALQGGQRQRQRAVEPHEGLLLA